MNSNGLRRPLSLAVAAIAALGVAALGHPVGAYADNGKVGGVRASLKRGTLDVKGGDEPNAVALRLSGDGSRIQVDAGEDGSADFSFAVSEVAEISVKMGDADDTARIDDANGGFTGGVRSTTITGGDGDDSLQGGQIGSAVNQVEKYKGGGGDDAIDGGRGNDSADLGEGDDSFRWDPGDGSDTVEGRDDTDTMVFNGASGVAGADTVTMSENGGRLTFFRQPASITMDTDGVEVVDFNALAGTDSVTVGDLADTDVSQTNVDLASTLGGSAADNQIDNVVVNGTDRADTIDITNNATGADVDGLATAVAASHADLNDVLTIRTGAGADVVNQIGAPGLQVLVDPV